MYTATLPNFLANLQAHLSEALPAYLNTTEIQAVDLRTSQQWLRTMVWKLSVSHPYLASVAHENALDFKYPVEITRDVLAMSPAFTQQTLDVCGIGLVRNKHGLCHRFSTSFLSSVAKLSINFSS